MAPEYAFFTRWRLRATAQEVYDVLADPFGLARWWPSVYLEVKELAPPDPAGRAQGGSEKAGMGRVVGLHTKGFLPYTLRWNFRVTESTPPTGFKLVAHGDFEGTGVWKLQQDGDFVDVTYDWPAALRQLRLEAVLRRQPPLGDGARGGEPGPGAGAPQERPAGLISPSLPGRRKRIFAAER